MNAFMGLDLKNMSLEQQARDLLERMGIDGAQDFSSGDLAELAELIFHKNAMDSLNITPWVAIDAVEIEGTKYSMGLFRELGCNFKSMVGQVIKVLEKNNGLVSIYQYGPPQHITLDGVNYLVFKDDTLP